MRLLPDKVGVTAGLILFVLLAACAPSENSAPDESEPVPSETPPESSVQPVADPDRYEDLRLVTLLPRDAIPAIDDPQFLDPSAADEVYDPSELILGVVFNGDARAYSVPLLSRHEIVNDTVGGVKIAVTW